MIRNVNLRLKHPVTDDTILRFRGSEEDARNLRAAQKAVRREPITNLGSHKLQDLTDDEFQDQFPSASAFMEEHRAGAPVQGAGPAQHAPAHTHSSSTIPPSPDHGPHATAYRAKSAALERNSMSSSSEQTALLDDLHLNWQYDSEREVKQAQEMLAERIAGYVANPLHSCNGVRCSGHARVSSSRPVSYRNLIHGFTISVPKLDCPVCLRNFEMPPTAAR